MAWGGALQIRPLARLGHGPLAMVPAMHPVIRNRAALGNFPQAFTHFGLILGAKECSLGEKGE